MSSKPLLTPPSGCYLAPVNCNMNVVVAVCVALVILVHMYESSSEGLRHDKSLSFNK